MGNYIDEVKYRIKLTHYIFSFVFLLIFILLRNKYLIFSIKKNLLLNKLINVK